MGELKAAWSVSNLVDKKDEILAEVMVYQSVALMVDRTVDLRAYCMAA
jgi:hypothetical protein